jgi:hypothetical protein
MAPDPNDASRTSRAEMRWQQGVDLPRPRQRFARRVAAKAAEVRAQRFGYVAKETERSTEVGNVSLKAGDPKSS